MFVNLKSLDNSINITSELINKVNQTNHRLYGITQDPESKNYMMVLNDECNKCYYACNAPIFQNNFKNWSSGNNDIDKLIQDTQLSAHENAGNALEWIPYDKLHNIKHIAKDEFGKIYEANWIDGLIDKWDDENQNWKRYNQNMFVNLKILNTPENLTLEFINKIKRDHELYGMTRNPKKKIYMMIYNSYGITQDPQTKNYMVILSDICKKCNEICNTTYFQRNFKRWTSGNNDIDKIIQDAQLSAHENARNALEWIPYDKFYNIKYIAKGGFGKVYKANWIDGRIWDWNDKNQNWERYGKNMVVALKSLNNSKNVTFEFMNEITSHHKIFSCLNNEH
ncbi:hypothetical protein C1646_662318 [Rhizophagus diaphanus]|nr:hypothetical protein C1646_662318 [Rhizophagus diaphanus] [Rhizophagus sp. MUCL 43196]